jgi:hypothetical protein
MPAASGALPGGVRSAPGGGETLPGGVRSAPGGGETLPVQNFPVTERKVTLSSASRSRPERIFTKFQRIS